jgi:hypothetical protein
MKIQKIKKILIFYLKNTKMAYSFNGFVIGEILILAVAVALLVILIVVLTRNNLSTYCDKNNLTGEECQEGKLTALDNKVNWLYALEIAAVGLMILAGVIAFFRVRSFMVVV